MDIHGFSFESRAVIIINAQSIIQLTNDSVLTMLGYSKAELKGKNLRILLPPNIAEMHSGFVRNYIITGKEERLAFRLCS
jgi:two-component system, LuxR family, sensor kinase FixL